jgi:hypothetical protein
MRNLLPLLGSLLKLQSLSGYRTYIAAVGLVIVGVSEAIAGDYDRASQSFLGALGLLGLHGKIDATTVPATTVTTVTTTATEPTPPTA